MNRVAPRTSAVASVAILLGLSAAHGEAIEADIAFQSVVEPFLRDHCIGCHGANQPKGKLRLDALGGDFQSAADAEIWNHVRSKLLNREMPPEEKPRPPAGLEQGVIRWIEQGLRLHYPHLELLNPDDRHLPKHGNRIDHESLFSGEYKGVASSPARLWRMSPSLYEGGPGGSTPGTSQPFSASRAGGFQDYAAEKSIDQASTGQLIRNARAIAARQTGFTINDGGVRGLPGSDPALLKLLIDVDPGKLPGRAAIEAAVRRQFGLVLLRDPARDEVERFSALMESSMRISGRETGIRTALAAVLLLPEAVYRFELGCGGTDAHGRQMLSPHELAFAIAFALTDRQPGGVLLRAASAGELATSGDVSREVRRILEADEIDKPRILRFFHEFFGYHRAAEVFKDGQLFPHHDAAVLVADTDLLVLHILKRDQQVFRELLTTEQSFVNFIVESDGRANQRSQRLVHVSYGLPYEWKWTADQPLQLPGGQRAGILTQPSWLVAHSSNFDNHAILRGKWVREHLLGGTIPDLPITVDAQLPDEPDQTLRHRMRVTRESKCWNCHRKMDPLGLTFETFDHFGRFRTEELGAPVQSAGRIHLTGDSRIEGEVCGAIDMLRRLAESDRARQMFVRHAFRYWMGRNEELTDSPTLIAADRAYLENAGSFKALLVSLLSSDSFIYRKGSNSTSTSAGPAK